MVKKIISLTVLLSLLISNIAFAGTFTGNSSFSTMASSIETTSIVNDSEQYLLTVSKDTGINSVTVKVGSTTISPSTSGGNTYWIDKGATATVSATAKSGYIIKSGTGSTGAINAAKTVSITSELVALKFSSDSNFTLSVATKGWDGTLQYSTNNGSSWTTWDGSQLSGTASQPIYLRGTENTKITGGISNKWTFTGKYCTGNIETLLDYQKVINGQHPTMAANCYDSMFQNCKSLTTAPSSLPATTLATACYARMFSACTTLTTVPSLPATTLTERCYFDMFNGCTSLTAAPSLPATTLAAYCYQNMFCGCTKLKVREGGSGTKIFTCPSTIPDYAVYRMFYNTGGTFTGTNLTAGKTYYYY